MNRYNKTRLAALFLALLLASCSGTKHATMNNRTPYKKLSSDDKRLTDTLIKKVLDNEGLYTVVSGLKPISSVTELSLKITNADTLQRGKSKITDTASADLQKLKRYQNIVNSLDFGDLKWMISPYRLFQKDIRTMQISIHRQSLIDSLLHVQQPFFGQFGFVPGTKAEILVNTTEYEHQYQRFRAYGYLFGYPDHAVDFFTDAAISNDKTGVFVKRNFLQIPVFSASKGRFVYAVPEGYKQTAVDSAIATRAHFNLLHYQKIRKKFQRPDGSVQYYKLLKKLIENGR